MKKAGRQGNEKCERDASQSLVNYLNYLNLEFFQITGNDYHFFVFLIQLKFVNTAK